MSSLKSLLAWPAQHPARAGTLCGWFQQGCGMLVALMLIPVVTRFLTPDQAGIWFAFQGLVAMIALLDLGFGFAISRQAAFTLGATEKTVAKDDFIHLTPGWSGVAQLFSLTRTLYRWLAAAAALVALLAFEVFSRVGNLFPPETVGVRWCWYGMALASCLLILTAGQSAFLNGLGAVYQTRFLAGLYQLAAGAGAALAAWKGWGLPAMGASFALCAVFYQISVGVVRKITTKPMDNSTKVAPPEGSLKRLARSALPVGTVNLFGSLIYVVQPVLLGALLGPAIIPAVYFALKAASSLNSLSLQYHSASLPGFTNLVSKGNPEYLINYLRRSIRISWSAQILVGAGILVLIPLASPIFLTESNFQWFPFLAILALDFVLLGIFVPMGQFVLASGNNPFVIQVILTGVTSVLLSALLIPLFGPTGLPIATLIANMAFHERAYLKAFLQRWPSVLKAPSA